MQKEGSTTNKTMDKGTDVASQKGDGTEVINNGEGKVPAAVISLKGATNNTLHTVKTDTRGTSEETKVSTTEKTFTKVETKMQSATWSIQTSPKVTVFSVFIGVCWLHNFMRFEKK